MYSNKLSNSLYAQYINTIDYQIHPIKLSNSLCAQAQIKYKTQPIVIHKSQTFGGKDLNIQISTLVKGNI